MTGAVGDDDGLLAHSSGLIAQDRKSNVARPTGRRRAPRGVRDRIHAIAEARGGRRGAAVSCCFQRRACSEASSQLAIRRALQSAHSETEAAVGEMLVG